MPDFMERAIKYEILPREFKFNFKLNVYAIKRFSHIIANLEFGKYSELEI